jgi:teichuronic acid biosynthesis glycosyltransferase TuaG
MTSDSVSADVTVIIPAYRARATIGRALASVAAQTLKPRAIVVVDDGSTDDTYAMAVDWQSRMPGIDLVVERQSNAGAGAARNRALSLATTTYVAFLDADDEWLPEKLARTMDHFAKEPDYVLVAHDSLEVNGTREVRLDCARRFREAIAAPFVGLYRRGYIDTTTVVARRADVMAVGGFDQTLPNAQDFDLWLAILAPPDARFMVFDEILSKYHRTAGSIMTHIERRRACCMKIAVRYAPALRRHPGSAFVSLWFRSLAIHVEAVRAHMAARNLAGAITTLARLPFSICAATISAVGKPNARVRLTAIS